MSQTLPWVFKHAPQTFEDMILHPDLRKVLEPTFERLPNMLLCGTPGIGKGTFIDVFLKKTGCKFIKINGSLENKIDTFEERVMPFASAFGGGKIKYVYYNEAEWLTRSKTADAFLDLMDKSSTRFIFCVNRKEGFSKELLSRFQKIDYFAAPAPEYYKYALQILKKEGVVPNKENLVKIIEKCYPDFRDTLNTLQLNCVDGKMIDSVRFSDEIYEEIFNAIKEIDLNKIRELIRGHSIDYVTLYELMFEKATEFKSPGDVIIEIADRLYKDTTIPNKEINLLGGVLQLAKKGAL